VGYIHNHNPTISIFGQCLPFKKKIVPAFYVFGDSTVDAGNNNNLNTLAKANVFPYGIYFNNCSTGRFTNDKTFADIIGNISIYVSVQR